MNLTHHRDTQRVFRKAAARALCTIVLAVLGLHARPAEAQTPWSLTKVQRQSYLNYYAPKGIRASASRRQAAKDL